MFQYFSPKPSAQTQAANPGEVYMRFCGLKASTTEASLREYFENFGTIRKLEIDKINKKRTGQGAITFASSQVAGTLHKNQVHTVDGSDIRIEKSNKQRPARR